MDLQFGRSFIYYPETDKVYLGLTTETIARIGGTIDFKTQSGQKLISSLSEFSQASQN